MVWSHTTRRTGSVKARSPLHGGVRLTHARRCRAAWHRGDEAPRWEGTQRCSAPPRTDRLRSVCPSSPRMRHCVAGSVAGAERAQPAAPRGAQKEVLHCELATTPAARSPAACDAHRTAAGSCGTAFADVTREAASHATVNGANCKPLARALQGRSGNAASGFCAFWMSSLDHAEFIEQKQKGGLNALRVLIALLLCAAAGGLGAGAYVTIKCVLLCGMSQRGKVALGALGGRVCLGTPSWRPSRSRTCS